MISPCRDMRDGASIEPLSLAVGRLQITSDVTCDRTELSFAVLHLGGWDFHCCVQSFRRRLDYQRAKDAVLEALTEASAAQVILAINATFGERAYTLQTLFAEERHRIMQLLSQATLQRLDQLYTQVYRNNYGLLKAFHRDSLSVPQELQVAAEVAIKHRALEGLRSLEQETSDPDIVPLQQGMSHLLELEAITHEAQQFNCNCFIPEGQRILEQLIWRSLRHFLSDPTPDTLIDDVAWLKRLITLGNNLGGISLMRSQELYWSQIHHWLKFLRHLEPTKTMAMLKPLLKLGQALSIDPNALLAHGASLPNLTEIN
ncbi:MAG: DUF3536 domain-containing protein [Leptolyngbya sp. SIO1D8]|nr:DUF3536 domain-containing protein [Leptolyngbya sp. SIO1D8]